MAQRVSIGQLTADLIFRDLTTQGLTRLERGLDRAQRRMQTASRVAFGMGAAFTGVLYSVGRTVFDFESAMNALQAATNASAEDMKQLREQAKHLGETTQFSAVQAADAQRQLGLAGMEVNQILGTMPGVLSLAAAGQLEMGEAAGITTGILAAYKLEASDSIRVSDVLAAAASSAKTTVAEMGVAFANTGVTAAAAGASIEQSAAALATFQQVNIQAPEAGTGLRNILGPDHRHE